MARVTGIGGVFVRARDPKALAAWYAEHLGMKPGEDGSVVFAWSDAVPAGTGMTVWSAFPEGTAYFGEGTEGVRQAVMVNFRVDDLDGLLKRLEAAGVWVDPKREDYGYGRFGWVRDGEGNRLELWEPLG